MVRPSAATAKLATGNGGLMILSNTAVEYVPNAPPPSPSIQIMTVLKKPCFLAGAAGAGAGAVTGAGSGMAPPRSSWAYPRLDGMRGSRRRGITKPGNGGNRKWNGLRLRGVARFAGGVLDAFGWHRLPAGVSLLAPAGSRCHPRIARDYLLLPEIIAAPNRPGDSVGGLVCQAALRETKGTWSDLPSHTSGRVAQR